MKIFAKLIEAAKKAMGRSRPVGTRAAYRPEKHYMRGAGPKSNQATPVGSTSPPKPP